MQKETSIGSGDWKKSSYCGTSTCVEVAIGDGFVAIRDSKDVNKPAHKYSHCEWSAFVAGVKDGQFDLPAR